MRGSLATRHFRHLTLYTVRVVYLSRIRPHWHRMWFISDHERRVACCSSCHDADVTDRSVARMSHKHHGVHRRLRTTADIESYCRLNLRRINIRRVNDTLIRSSRRLPSAGSTTLRAHAHTIPEPICKQKRCSIIIHRTRPVDCCPLSPVVFFLSKDNTISAAKRLHI